MRKISANYIFPVNSKPLKNGIVEINDYGEVTKIIDTGGKIKEIAGLEYYNGFLVPGFINTHCHLELSHYRKKIANNNGITGFITELTRIKNNFSEEQIIDNIEKADKLMQIKGIVAVGDISNTTISFKQKYSSKIHYHTFVEIYNIDDNKASETFENGLKIVSEAKKHKQSVSLTPHSAYSVSKKLLELLKSHSNKPNYLVSIHNQESNSENELFVKGSGKLNDFLKTIDSGYTIVNKKQSSLMFLLEHLNANNKILLVHNTFTSEKDIEFAENFSNNIYYVLCPNSNLFIENKLPDINMFYNKKTKLTIGTDSLASNNTLSILEEIKTILKHTSGINFEEVLKWATINGAKALNIERKSGSFEKGKIPGINLIENVDIKNITLTKNSSIKVIA